MKETIRTILYSWLERELPEVIDRDVDLGVHIHTKPRKIIAITGFRRVGKTYLVYDVLKELLKSGAGKMCCT